MYAELFGENIKWMTELSEHCLRLLYWHTRQTLLESLQQFGGLPHYNSLVQDVEPGSSYDGEWISLQHNRRHIRVLSLSLSLSLSLLRLTVAHRLVVGVVQQSFCCAVWKMVCTVQRLDVSMTFWPLDHRPSQMTAGGAWRWRRVWRDCFMTWLGCNKHCQTRRPVSIDHSG